MKRIMITAGVAALLLGTAGESRAEETKYVENVKVVQRNSQQIVKLTVFSNNITCGPKTLTPEETASGSWVVPISSVCGEKQLAKLERNDVWFRIELVNYDPKTLNKTSDLGCKGQHIKYQTGSGGGVRLQYYYDYAYESPKKPNLKVDCK